MSTFVDRHRPSLSAKGLRFGIVASRFNRPVTARLLKGTLGILKEKGAKRVDVSWVPGAFEIPLALSVMARRRRYDALIAVGAVIRGGTPHFEYVSSGATHGVMEVMLRQKIPISFGILTTNNLQQALARSGGRHGHKGREAAEVAIEMARFVKKGRANGSKA